MNAMATVGPTRRPAPRAAVHEEPGEYVLELDVCDLTPGELVVEVVGCTVVVRGERPEDGDGGPFSRRERLEESIRLPDDVDPAGVWATYGRGTLELRARRRRPLRRRIPVERRFLVSATPGGC